jgi:hypothetical protein
MKFLRQFPGSLRGVAYYIKKIDSDYFEEF